MQPTAGTGRIIADRYRVGARLGRGGMAEVFDGFDERLARPVAIKVLRPDQSADRGVRERFEREARAAAGLSHPSVVAVYDSGEDGGDAYLVMERLPGETLSDRMRAGPVQPAWLTGVAIDVLSALAAAHAKGIVHRDIKPANILIAADGRAKVADFGIAKAFSDDHGMPADATRAMSPYGDDLTATGMVLGTVAYLSPEQIDGSPASPQSDLYALGVVLWEALAGRKPYVGDSPVAQARAAAAGGAVDIATVRPDVPPGLAATIRRAMRRNPAERYPSAAAMRTDLEQVAAYDATRVARVEGTAVMPAAPRPPVRPPAAPIAPPPVLADPPREGSGWKALIAVLVVLVIAAAVAVILITSNHGGGSNRTAATTSTSSSSSTTTTTVDTVAVTLRNDAAAFDKVGTPGTSTIASLFTSVADTPAGTQRIDAADQAGETISSLYENGRITESEFTAATDDLLVVPGASAPSTTTTSTTTTSTSTSTSTSTTTTTLPANSGNTGNSGSGNSGNSGSGNSGNSGNTGSPPGPPATGPRHKHGPA